MDDSLEPHPTPKRPRRSHSIPTRQRISMKRLVALDAAGASQAEIARDQGVTPQAIHKVYRAIEVDVARIGEFRKRRADIFAKISEKSLRLQEAIVDSFGQDYSVLATLSPAQRGSLLHSLSIHHGVLYDKERLERGQSTENIHTIARLLGGGVDAWVRKQGKAEDCSDLPQCGEMPQSEQGDAQASSSSPAPASSGSTNIMDAASRPAPVQDGQAPVPGTVPASGSGPDSEAGGTQG